MPLIKLSKWYSGLKKIKLFWIIFGRTDAKKSDDMTSRIKIVIVLNKKATIWFFVRLEKNNERLINKLEIKINPR